MKFKILLSAPLLLTYAFAAETYYYSFGKKIPLTPLTQKRTLHEMNSTVSYYQMPNGEKVGVKNEVIIGCKSIAQCQHLLKNYPIESVEKLSDTLYLLLLKKGSDPFGVANALHEEAPITLAHPNFIRQRKAR